jgi:hypothetical protein
VKLFKSIPSSKKLTDNGSRQSNWFSEEGRAAGAPKKYSTTDRERLQYCA